ncbi:thermonuclease family protein [Aestuariirhabdus litorea]|uniref:Thermonuclease family protein n=1 Tax=Aestuariirhabdus litorea TaxID=2528527 RepID=A0A3P3VMN2_9GAMM|nr:thermonuclease family protein [Aestuariirhabdus litorea]RRJ83148.1 thermonuclease family protein [Aestuariirhabdus litorea]RWW93305.1 thermonuclease family protein [Endozoicomonadaceae bacterium GTF-13]
MGVWKKALVASAFFIAWNLAQAQSCGPEGTLERVEWQRVFDGDTLLLRDGRRVRLVGVNTPELGRDGRSDGVGARAAKAFVEQRLRGGEPLLIEPAEQPRDRYGRLLARVYLGQERRSLSELLLEQGLGVLVVVPPNERGWGCLAQAEARARARRLGVWRSLPSSLSGLTHSGFYLLEGRVTGVNEGGDALWVALGERLVLRFSRHDLARFPALERRLLKGQRLEVRGWVIDRQARGGKLKPGHRRWMLPVRHPAMVRFID